MNIKTIKDIKKLQGKTILVRVDYNVPINAKGKIEDDTRIKESLPTIKHLLENKAKIILVTHLGRPDGEEKEDLRTAPIAKHLGELLKKKIKTTDQVVNQEVKKMAKLLKEGEILMLENIRFKKEEEKNDTSFSKELASLADIYINDAFGTAHRKHASTFGVTKFLPSYGGLLMEKEINALTKLVDEEPARPLALILGGAKIDTKIGMIEAFMEKSDYVLLGGGLANTFLAAAGYNMGGSLYEKEKLETAREIMLEFEKHHERLILPHDVIVTDEIKEDAPTANILAQDVLGEMKIVDIGKWTIEKYCNIITQCATVIWNGPMGIHEIKIFRNGTEEIGKCIANHICDSIIGGGDTIDALKKSKIDLKKFTHVSTGGGACIEFLEGKKLPGIKALE